MGVIYNGRKQQDGKKGVELWNAQKWIRAKRRPPKGSPWQVSMED